MINVEFFFAIFSFYMISHSFLSSFCEPTIQLLSVIRTTRLEQNVGFAESSSIQILDLQRDAPPYHYKYSYTLNKDNYNERTIQGMSLSAKQMMYEDCNKHESGKGSCPYEEYMKFVHYYNSYTYADEFVQAALDERSTVLSHGIDFTNYEAHIRAGK